MKRDPTSSARTVKRSIFESSAIINKSLDKHENMRGQILMSLAGMSKSE